MEQQFLLTQRICLLYLLILVAFSTNVAALSSESLFETNKTRLFQIKVLDAKTNSRSSIGSGFIVEDAFTLATNYHVISSVISEPEKYRIVALGADGEETPVQIQSIDIVNDLALLKSDLAMGEPFALAQSSPAKGALVYSMGNPHDLGTTLVQGTYNGLAETTFYKRIHFSGSVNAGMSGGPAFNNQGEVIGINVSSAGEQLSFLVPVGKLKLLLQTRHNSDANDDFLAQSEQQLIDSQNKLITSIQESNWPTVQLGEAQVIGDLPELVNCWGRTEERDADSRLVSQFSKGCSLQDSIFINRNTTTGSLHYQFSWVDAESLSERRFFRYLENHHMAWYADNRAHQDDTTSFKCYESLIDKNNASDTVKSFFCARRYKHFPDLFDVLYTQLEKRGNQALVSHFTLAGVTQDSANTFRNGFVRHVVWP